MNAKQGEYWCPDCHKKVADNYQQVAEKCGRRGREIWQCPTCAQDLVLVDTPIVMCPYCDRELVHSIPDSSNGYIIECPKHGQMRIDIFKESISARQLDEIGVDNNG